MVQAASATASPPRALKLTADEVIGCIVCSHSRITLKLPAADSKVVYAGGSAKVNSIFESAVWDSALAPMRTQMLASERFVSDFHFSKDATFYHRIRNQAGEPMQVLL